MNVHFKFSHSFISFSASKEARGKMKRGVVVFLFYLFIYWCGQQRERGEIIHSLLETEGNRFYCLPCMLRGGRQDNSKGTSLTSVWHSGILMWLFELQISWSDSIMGPRWKELGGGGGGGFRWRQRILSLLLSCCCSVLQQLQRMFHVKEI